MILLPIFSLFVPLNSLAIGDTCVGDPPLKSSSTTMSLLTSVVQLKFSFDFKFADRSQFFTLIIVKLRCFNKVFGDLPIFFSRLKSDLSLSDRYEILTTD